MTNEVAVMERLAVRLRDLARQLRPGLDARDEDDVADDLDALADQLDPKPHV